MSAPPRSAGWSLAQLAVLAGAAAVLAAPFLLFGALPGHSTIYNVTWTSQFVAAVAGGTAYPRWLPDSFAGLGSPAFFFYAPLPFYWAWLHAPLGVAAEGTFRLLGVSMATMLLASGVTMRLWLGRHAGPRAATAGAVAYMAMPYHLLDLYQRASLGELAAYAVVPLVAIGVSRLAREGARAIVPLAVSAALLVTSHLPTAMAAATIVFPAQFVFEALRTCRSPAWLLRRSVQAIAAGVLAVGIAAVYLLPAIALQEHVSFYVMQDDFYDPRNWLLRAPGRWRNDLLLIFVASLSSASGILAFLCWLKASQGRDGASVRFWSATAAFILLAIVGLVPGLWEPWSPFFRGQFPWRLLLFVEFAIVTAIVALGFAAWRRRRDGIAILTIVFVGVPAFVTLIGGTWIHIRSLESAAWQALRTAAIEGRPDALEYLPNGALIRYAHDGGYDVGRFAEMFRPYSFQGIAWAEPESHARVAAAARRDGGIGLEISATRDVTIVIRRFYFPTWRLDAADGTFAPPLEAHGPDRLLSFRVPAGQHALSLRWAPPWTVRVGEIVSIASLALSALVIAIFRRRRHCGRQACPREKNP
ncbi:hypothetical protein [Neoroseomonas rubea]|uniref:hypothetical protein n=1 Tax=Neoroseomonas rubea TaxID=2748666 RepID=UPI0018DF2B04|nr:hypothetical protein [Roseomonas rubea]